MIAIYIGYPFIQNMPICALSGIITYSALRIIKFEKWDIMYKYFKLDFAMCYVCFFGIIIFDVKMGAILSFVFSLMVTSKYGSQGSFQITTNMYKFFNFPN